MGNVLLVTGASSDVGVALIRRVAGNYDKIICHYNHSEKMVGLLKEEFGDKIIPLSADFSDQIAVSNFIKNIFERELIPDHFVHISSSREGSVNVKFAKTDWEQFERELNVSFRSAVMLCQAFLPEMAKKKRGRVAVMLSSQIMWEPHKPYAAPYICTKYALLGLVKSLSAEYIGKGITVNGVSPSMIDTKFLQIPETVKEINAAASPIKRLLTVEDVVPVFEFLLSSGADTITGQNIAVTAGC